MNAKVMIVEDDGVLADSLEYNFIAAKYTVCVVRDGHNTLKEFDSQRPDLVILDWVLPSLSGVEVCGNLRAGVRSRDVPIIMLAGHREGADVVHSLNCGADDHVEMPFSMPLLFAKVNALIRRANIAKSVDALTLGDVQLNRESHRVTRGRQRIDLGPTEYLVLELMLENPNRILSRGQILIAVWGSSSSHNERIVDTHVARLRKRLNKDAMSDPIITVKDVGYKLIEPTDACVP